MADDCLSVSTILSLDDELKSVSCQLHHLSKCELTLNFNEPNYRKNTLFTNLDKYHSGLRLDKP